MIRASSSRIEVSVSFPRQRLGLTYRTAASTLRPVFLAGTRREWRGQHYLPPEGTGFIAAANHISHVDPLLTLHFLYDSGRAPRVLAKDSLFEAPVLGPIMTHTEHVPVTRGTGSAAEALKPAVEALEAGECLLIFPEGTLTRDPDLWPMRGKTGAARMSLMSGRPVIPIAHWGVHRINKPYSKVVSFFPPKQVTVAAGPPVDLDDLRGQELSVEVLREATDRIMADIVGLLEQIRGVQAPSTRFDPRAAGVSEFGSSGQ